MYPYDSGYKKNMQETNEKSKVVKKRHWAFVAYPDSVPGNWKEILQQTGLQCAISPLHDKDINAEGENDKKPHWHIILTYSGPTTESNVRNLTVSLNATMPIPLDSVKGYYRYLTHKDNPEKYQYNEAEIQTINGFNIAEFVELTKHEVSEIKRNLHKLIKEQGMIEYSEFMDYLLENSMFLEYDVASKNTLFFDRYLRSRFYIAMQK